MRPFRHKSSLTMVYCDKKQDFLQKTDETNCSSSQNIKRRKRSSDSWSAEENGRIQTFSEVGFWKKHGCTTRKCVMTQSRFLFHWHFLFNDNLATDRSLTGVILSCHVERSKKQRHKETNSKHTEIVWNRRL